MLLFFFTIFFQNNGKFYEAWRIHKSTIIVKKNNISEKFLSRTTP